VSIYGLTDCLIEDCFCIAPNLVMAKKQITTNLELEISWKMNCEDLAVHA